MLPIVRHCRYAAADCAAGMRSCRLGNKVYGHLVNKGLNGRPATISRTGDVLQLLLELEQSEPVQVGRWAAAAGAAGCCGTHCRSPPPAKGCCRMHRRSHPCLWQGNCTRQRSCPKPTPPS